MKIDVLVAEIGSTTTVMNAFTDIFTENPKFVGQGQAPTSVKEGDVNVGIKEAIESLKASLNIDNLDYGELFATSSAAGGLRMTVHGLVYDMTVRAAKEAALGAGANIHQITAGRMRNSDLNKLKAIRPNIILIAGGVDFGERDTALYNAEKIAELGLDVPIIYAGNVENQEEMKLIFAESNAKLYLVENVYPKIDLLNVEPTRKAIQEVFEEHITHAPGMQRVRETVNGNIIPTPGAVMSACVLLKERLGDLMAIDVGGATTDVHSVTEGSEKVSKILISPEPIAKRTVEGDLGMYVSLENVYERVDKASVAKSLGISQEELQHLFEEAKPIPQTELEKKFIEKMCEEAVVTSVRRHAGHFRDLFSTNGKTTVAEGKDLTMIQYIIGTGGALTRLPDREEILKKIAWSNKGNELFPTEHAQILIDNDYIMASLGVLSMKYEEAAYRLLLESLALS